MRFVVYGAGAVGGVLGGHLALEKHDVLLVCRKAHAEEIEAAGGLKMVSARGEYIASLRATTSLVKGDLDEDTCVFFTPKSYDTKDCVAELAGVAPKEIPVVSFQNGVTNEEIIAGEFENVFGGICRMTCSMLHPGRVSFRKTGRLVIGKYPRGAHPLPKKLAPILEEAGFDVAVSNAIMCDKWLKLVVNLQSGLNAVIDPRDHDSVEFMELKVGVLEEAKKVLRADKVRARSCDDRDLSIDDVINELRKPKAPRPSSGVRVNNSTWQNLYLKRKQMENAYFHGPVIDLAKAHGIAVRFNETALDAVRESSRKELGPGAYRAREMLELVKQRSSDL